MSQSPPLRVCLEKYDGTHTAILESLALELEGVPDGVSAEIWDEAFHLATEGEAGLAAGATWLLRRWLESGLHPPSSALAGLSGRLGEVRDRWARLHLLQALPSIRLPGEQVPVWAAFCRAGLVGDAPFLRAWSVNALAHLASIDPTLESEANEALQAALSDPKASVRARARKILERR